MFEHIDIETHNICNRACGYCPVSLDKRGPESKMPTFLFVKIIDELTMLEYSGRINLNLYNEPLLDDRLDRMVYMINVQLPAARLHIYSNGDYLTVERVTRLISLGVNSIKITDHNEVPNPRLRILMEELGEAYSKQVTLHKFDAQSALHNRGGSLDHAWTQKKTHVCWPAVAPHAYIDFKGNMVSCCDDAFSATTFGNVADLTIMEIWNSPEYVQFRDGLNKDRFYFDICAKCNVNKGKDIKLATFV